MHNELTREEYRFVIGLLDGMTLQGTAEQVRPALALRDSALEKLRKQLSLLPQLAELSAKRDEKKQNPQRDREPSSQHD